MTTFTVLLLAALVVVALLPFILLHEWPIWRRAHDYSPYQREIPITRTEGRVVDLTGAKPGENV